MDKVTWQPTATPPDDLAAAVDSVLAYTTGGDGNWSAVSGGYYGGDSAASPSLSLNQESWMQTTVQGAGTFSFWAKLSAAYSDPQPTPPDQFAAATNCLIPFTTGGDAAWQVTTGGHGDNDSVYSGDLEANQSNWLQTTVQGEGTFSFWWKSPSSDSGSSLYFYIDGQTKSSLSGDQESWQQVSWAITGSGTHTLKWVFSRSDDEDDNGAGYVDAVGWTGYIPQPPIPPAPLRFYVDGVEQYGCKTNSWEQKSYTISGSGTHTLKWLFGRYRSDWSGTGSVDDVGWTGYTPQPPAQAEPGPEAWKLLTYTYDASGRRIEKKYDGTTQVKYVYDGDQCVAEYDGSGTLLRKYIYGPGIDHPVSMIESAGGYAGTYYYHFDGSGSVVALTNSSGNTVEVYEYAVYGKVGASDASHPNRFMFTGREFDKETGLYYYRARYYKPEIGRFLQTDPTGYRDGLNIYRYCANAPTNAVDPSGLSIQSMTAQGYTVAGYVIMPDGTWIVLYTTPDGSTWNVAGVAYAILGTHPDCVGIARSGGYAIYFKGCQASYGGLPYPDLRGAWGVMTDSEKAAVGTVGYLTRAPHDPNGPVHHEGPHQDCYSACDNEHTMSMVLCPLHCGLEGPGVLAACLARSNATLLLCIAACDEPGAPNDDEGPPERYAGTMERAYEACHIGNFVRRIVGAVTGG